MVTLIGRHFKKIITRGAVIALFAMVLVYAGVTMKDYLVGVRLHIEGVTDGETRTDPKVTIRGIAKNIAQIRINDHVVGVAEDGTFADSFLLLPGYNVISVNGNDKFGKHVAKNFRVFLKDTANATALSQPTVPHISESRNSITN